MTAAALELAEAAAAAAEAAAASEAVAEVAAAAASTRQHRSIGAGGSSSSSSSIGAGSGKGRHTHHQEAKARSSGFSWGGSGPPTRRYCPLWGEFSLLSYPFLEMPSQAHPEACGLVDCRSCHVYIEEELSLYLLSVCHLSAYLSAYLSSIVVKSIYMDLRYVHRYKPSLSINAQCI